MKSYSILLASFLVILVSACSSGPQIIVVPEETYRAYATYHKATCNLYKKAYAMLDKAEKARSRFAQHCKRTHPKRIFVRQNDQIIARAAITYGALLEDKAIFRAAGAETLKVEKSTLPKERTFMSFSSPWVPPNISQSSSLTAQNLKPRLKPLGGLNAHHWEISNNINCFWSEVFLKGLYFCG